MSAANLQTEWAALLLTSLTDAGVRDVVISPGSRSTPFVIAAVRERRLTRHESIDERAAAFYALGQARVTGCPSVVLCTSGTAAAHYLPAMIEADHTGTPMILLTADRPHELYDCSAPQTIDQVKLFGEHARHFFDLVPEASDEAFRALRRTAAQAVSLSLWPRAGAVHINARARKPLEPVVAKTPEEIDLATRARALTAVPITIAPRPRITPAPSAVEHAANLLRGARRGVIVVGPAQLAQREARRAIWKLSGASGFPVVGDATSQLRFAPKPAGAQFTDGIEFLLRSRAFRAQSGTDGVIQVGAPPTSGSWEPLPSAVPHVVLAEHGWPDPLGVARAIVFGDIEASCDALADALHAGSPAPDPDAAYAKKIRAANEAAWQTVDRELSTTETLVEATAIRALVAAAPESSLLVVGNSLSVRLIDMYVRACDREIGVLSQRGASGIDGLIAGAAGAAISADRPLALILGDVSFLYDVSSLALAARARRPLIVFVLHNGGGRIFEQLALASTPGIEPEVLGHAVTPHQTELASAAALYGVRYARVTSLPEVTAAVAEAYAHQGCTLLEVRVEPSGAIPLGRRVTSAVDQAILALSTSKGSA